jgi:4-methyl-5(b-hydroxyethyl)-thiazole monophosphate biosynthesis
MKKAIVLLADGFEDVEAVTPIDYLKRAGIEVTTVSTSDNSSQDGLIVTSSWGKIKLIADTTLKELINNENNLWDAIIIPGGLPGATNLAASKETSELIKKMASAGKLICAICASPVVVLSPLGLLEGKKYTCYPGIEKKVFDTAQGGEASHLKGLWSDDKVVVDGNIITSQGAGTSGLFAIAIIEKLIDETAGKKIADAVLL